MEGEEKLKLLKKEFNLKNKKNNKYSNGNNKIIF